MQRLISILLLQFRNWILFICMNSTLSSFAQPFINIESGGFVTGINDIRNGNNGTLFLS
jgi:hypothetical protein